MVSFDCFFFKLFDDPTDWTARLYSPIKGGLPSLFHSLKNETVSRYRDASWTEEKLSFVAYAFTSHLQARFQDDFETLEKVDPNVCTFHLSSRVI